MTPDWLETGAGTWDRVGRCVFGVEDGGEVVALAPIDRTWVGGLAVLRPLGLGVSDYFDLLLPPEPERAARPLAAFADALVERGGAWDALDLRGVPAESPTVTELIAAASARGMRHAIVPGHAARPSAWTGPGRSF